LAQVVDELLRDPDQRQRLARGGYDKVVAQFDRAANVRALADLFLDAGRSSASC